jgi:hypothetical protein
MTRSFIYLMQINYKQTLHQVKKKNINYKLNQRQTLTTSTLATIIRVEWYQRIVKIIFVLNFNMRLIIVQITLFFRIHKKFIIIFYEK